VTVQLMHLLVVEPYQVVVLRVAMVALALVAVGDINLGNETTAQGGWSTCGSSGGQTKLT